MKISGFILLIVIVSCTALISCGGEESFRAFQEIPDADLGSEYFEHLIENYGQYINVYGHLFLEYMQENPHSEIETELGNEDGAYIDLYEASYQNFIEKYPDRIELIRSNIPKLHDMVGRINYMNRVAHFETMKYVIDSYVSAAYINAPVAAAEPTEPQADETDENGEITPPPAPFVPPVDIDYARENIADFVTAEFLAKNPHGAVADYLKENNIHVTKIVFSEVFKEFEQHIYPFRIGHDYRIYYYTGDTPVEDEKKWQTATVRAVYFLTMNEENRQYAISYISDPAVMQEIINADDPKIEDFQLIQ
jgi:hypothetical protein